MFGAHVLGIRSLRAVTENKGHRPMGAVSQSVCLSVSVCSQTIAVLMLLISCLCPDHVFNLTIRIDKASVFVY